MAKLFFLLTIFFVRCTSIPLPPKNITKDNLFFINKKKLLTDAPVHRFKLANGLNILILPDKSSPTFAYQTWYKVGSAYEQKGKTGLAHFFEHLMFKATQNYALGKADTLLSMAGANNRNASTSEDFTYYRQELTHASDLDLIAHLDADRMANLIINPITLKTELDVVKQERRFRVDNDPNGQINEELNMLLFQNSPYGWPVIGYEKDLNTLQEQDAKDFYHTFYAPNNATIVISGNVDPSEAVMTIDKHYGKLEKKPLPPQPLNTADPFTISKKRKKLKLNLLNDKVIISYPIGPITDPEHPIRTILANLLTSGNSTRLSRALIDQNIATSVFAHAQNHMLNSSFQIEVDLQHKKKASLAEKIVLSELKKLCGGMIELEELNRAKLQIQYHLYSALYNRSHSAFLIGFYETVAGNFELLQEQFEAIQKIQPEEVLTVAKKIFKPENRFVITGVTH